MSYKPITTLHSQNFNVMLEDLNARTYLYHQKQRQKPIGNDDDETYSAKNNSKRRN